MTDMVMMPGADYQAICDAVRDKTGGTELLKSGELATLIAALGNGEEPVQVPSLSGRKVVSGTLNLATDHADYLNAKYINFGKDIVPVAAFVFPLNAKYADEDGNAVKYIVAKFKFQIEGAMDNSWTNGGTIVSTAPLSIPNSASQKCYGVNWTNGLLELGASSSYPMKAGITYMWIVIGEEV